MSLLCRELVDLLKMAPQCRIPFSKFIPAYHHHFGRQCRVADYGYTRLIDLLESLSHVVQVYLAGPFLSWILLFSTRNSKKSAFCTLRFSARATDAM